ncbi:hypothetical protein AALP_AAs73675U000500 [Arabis alpina]|uniref:Uncharacterized protein n=1 Tax=Arabis alpina TaxID=50452 RepID=A0A087FZW5_ARAAL|nr:hypothetical protein AALP_AAs73675U000500 [Arabis alpina]
MSTQEYTTLKSICYKPGSLHLLDQRKLLLETTYLEIRDTVDRWSAIQEMVVRGAPAIAIAATLSLAVAVFNVNAFHGSSADDVAFLQNNRPTAVNLADAALKLKHVIANTLVTATEPSGEATFMEGRSSDPP